MLDTFLLEQISGTLTVALSNLGGAISNFLAKIGEAGSYRKAANFFNFLKTKILEFTRSAGFKPLAEFIGGWIAKPFERLRPIISRFFEDAKLGDIKGAFERFMPDMINALSRMFQEALQTALKKWGGEAIIEKFLRKIADTMKENVSIFTDVWATLLGDSLKATVFDASFWQSVYHGVGNILDQIDVAMRGGYKKELITYLQRYREASTEGIFGGPLRWKQVDAAKRIVWLLQQMVKHGRANIGHLKAAAEVLKDEPTYYKQILSLIEQVNKEEERRLRLMREQREEQEAVKITPPARSLVMYSYRKPSGVIYIGQREETWREYAARLLKEGFSKAKVTEYLKALRAEEATIGPLRATSDFIAELGSALETGSFKRTVKWMNQLRSLGVEPGPIPLEKAEWVKFLSQLRQDLLQKLRQEHQETVLEEIKELLSELVSETKAQKANRAEIEIRAVK